MKKFFSSKRTPMTRRARMVLVLLAGVIAVAGTTVVRNGAATPEEITLNEAVSLVEAGKALEANLDDTSSTVTLKLKADDKLVVAKYPMSYGDELTGKLLDQDVEVRAEPFKSGGTTQLLVGLLPVLLLIAVVVWYLRRSSGIGRLGSRGAAAERPEVHFSDVAGADETVSELAEIVEYLRDPGRFETTGAVPSRGVLLLGPPGTGKTLLARAVAGEAQVPFFALSGADFVEVFAGVGAKRVREVFATARKAGKAIIFIDEVDAIGKKRHGSSVGGANEEREQALNALLVEMDGFVKSSVVVLAATNRSDVLDAALLRPGRFDRKITVGLPDRTGREAILRLHVGERNLADDVDLASLAKRTPGMAGADLAQLINEAALEAARNGRTALNRDDFERAIGTVVLGKERRTAVISDADRRLTAWHEAGHTVCALVQPAAPDPVTVSIVPRGHAGGVTWMDGDDSAYIARNVAWARLVTAMGGRAAEKLLLDGSYTQGAEGDFATATNLAVHMVARWGMTDAGFFSYDLDTLAYGEQGTEVRAAVNRLLGEAMVEADRLVAEHRVLLETIAAQLLEDETLHIADLMAIRGTLDAAAAATEV
jgi:cell division protease FtsH